MTRFALAGAAIAALTAVSAFAAPPASTPAPAPAPAPQVRPQGPRGMMGGGDESVTRAQVQAETAAQFAEMDSNKDGFVTAQELGDRGPNMIDRLDANHDGKLTIDEINTRILQMFDMVDANHDGTVTPAERDAFRAAMRAQRGGGGTPGGPGDQPPGQ
jgi:hypothetical protein